MLVVAERLERLAAVVAGVAHIVVVDLVLGLQEFGTEEHAVDIYRLTEGDSVGCHATHAAGGLRAGPLVGRSHILRTEILHLNIVDGSIQGHVVGSLDEEILAHEVVGILHLYNHIDIPSRLYAVLGVGVHVGSHVEDDTLAVRLERTRQILVADGHLAVVLRHRHLSTDLGDRTDRQTASVQTIVENLFFIK